MDEELDCIEREFIEIAKVDNQAIEGRLSTSYKRNHQNSAANININAVTTTTHILVFHYKGGKGEKPIKSLYRHVKKVLPENHFWRYAHGSKNPGSFFNMKGQTKLEHINDLTYLKCPEDTCLGNYLKETAKRINERVLEHIGQDKKSHIWRNTLQSCPASASSLYEFKILGKGFNNNRQKRKL